MTASIDDLTGRQLGSYRIVSQVGAGGMAAVYKAYQANMDRYVAIKVLPRSMASDPQFTSRFENEARLLARLQHPHILPVFDSGQADGYAYFVMPLVETGTLAQRLHGQPLPLDQLRTFVSQIGDALDYAHSRGLLHRDVKPSNVLVDERDNYLLTDFGIAKLVDGSTNLTATGTLIGTPAYMSPEQGQGRNLDRRSDLYSLGVIIYELAAGQVPFTADTPVAVIFKHVSEPLPPVDQLNPNLPPALVQVINRVLAKRPEERFQTGRELVEAVEASIEEASEPRPLAATMLEPLMTVPPPAYTNAAPPPPVYNPAPSSTGMRPATMAAPPAAAPPGPPPSMVGGYTGALPAPVNPPRRNWLGALLGLGGLGVVALVGLVLVGCLATYFLYPQLFGLAANPAATQTPAATAKPTRAPTETSEPDPTSEPDEPTATPRPTRTPAPTVEIVSTEIVIGVDNAYRDDFEDSGSGWDISADDTAALDYVDGEYAIQIAVGHTFMTSRAPAGDFTNVHLAFNARTVGQTTDAPVMGLMCDMQPNGAYYYMGFSVDGYYGIAYFDGQNNKFLTNDKNEWSPTTAVEKFGDSYFIEADCGSDGTLRLTVDDVVLAEVVDTSLISGGVGVFAQSFDEVPVDVRFDNLEATAAGATEVLFSDDFNSGGNWWTGSNADHAIAYTGGRYVIDVYSPTLIAWGNPNIDVSNAHVAVTVYNASAETQIGFGLICNYQPDTGEYYYLGFGSDGYYVIGFYDGQGTNALTSGDNTWIKSDAITVGGTEYQLEADCADDGTLRLIVDGVEIASVESDTYTSGDIGLFVETWDKVPAEIAFDNLIVTALP